MSCLSVCSAWGVQFGEIHYKDTLIDYSKVDKDATLKLADYYFDRALNANSKDEQKDCLEKSSREYFLLTKLEPNNLYPMIRMARIYDYEGSNSYAKAYFFQALKIDKNNAETNYYFGEYYYTREDYRRALHYYNEAFENGFEQNYEVIIKMALMYEKLGDLLRANQYYKKAYLISPEDEMADKIRNLEALKYKSTGYYNYRKIRGIK